MSGIAIVGLSCRFPGANSKQTFWSNLLNGVDSVVETPAHKWSSSLFSENKDRKGTVNCKYGGYLEDEYLSKFDNDFFSISGREAKVLDPQQKMLMELTWEALEDAGASTDSSVAREWGVFIGIGQADFNVLHMSDLNQIDTYTQTGLSHSIAPNRISNFFNLTGPSMAVDTACSSSLVALHQAVNAIQLGECSAAVVGGVNLMLHPSTSIGFSKLGVLSLDGKCHTFDASASGYVRGEGAGVVIVKKLEDALRDGDSIYAVVKGSAINEDGGGKPSLTTPSSEAQKKNMQSAYERSGVSPSDVYFVEAHGTGTRVGDANEAKSIGSYFGQGREGPMLIGSVKTNVGHLECASGMAGLIKTVLMIKNRTLVPHLHFKVPNPDIDLQKLNIEIVTEARSIEHEGSLIMGVNSFGFGGTNAHIILEEAKSARNEFDHSGPILVPLSAKSSASLSQLASEISASLSTRSEDTDVLAKVSAALTHYRAQHKYRKGIVASNLNDLLEQLNELQQTASATKAVGKNSNVAFVFSGQGPQWRDMGKQLYSSSTVYKNAVDECDKLFTQLSGWSLLEKWEELTEDQIHEPAYAQPGLFFLQIGLLRLYQEKGVKPTSVVGHSMGEVASFYAAGVISFQDAIKVVYGRSSLQQKTVGHGNMLAVGLSKEKCEEMIISKYPTTELASINSPNSVTLAGSLDVLEQISKDLTADKVFNRILRGKCGFHSSSQEMIKEETIQYLSSVEYRQPSIPLYSTVTGSLYDQNSQEYWWRNIRHAVSFQSAVENMIADGNECYVELGPHPVLTSSIIECSQGKDLVCISAMKRQTQEDRVFTESLAQLYEFGASIKSSTKYTWNDLAYLNIPTYPWNRSFSTDIKVRSTGVSDKICGKLDSSSVALIWKNYLSSDNYSLIGDHKIQNRVIFPGAGMIVMCAQASLDHFGPTNQLLQIENIKFINSLGIEDEVESQVHITKESNSVVNVQLWTVGQKKVLHGSMRTNLKNVTETPYVDIEDIRRRCNISVLGKSDIYNKLSSAGIQLGPQFRLMNQMSLGDNEAFCEVASALNDKTHQVYGIDIPFLDTCLQSLIGATDYENTNWIPFSIEQLQFFGTVEATEIFTAYVHSQLEKSSNRLLRGTVTLFREDGSVIFRLKGFEVKGFQSQQGTTSTKYAIEWSSVDTEKQEQPKERYVIFNDKSDFAMDIAGQVTSSVIIDASTNISTAVTTFADGDGIIYLPSMDENVEYVASRRLLQLVQTLEQLGKPILPIWVVTKGVNQDKICPENGSFIGLGRTIRSEKVRGVDVFNIDISVEALNDRVSAAARLRELITSQQLEREFTIDASGVIQAPRFIKSEVTYSDDTPADVTNQRILKLKFKNGEPGSVDDVEFKEDVLPVQLGPDEVEVIPYAVGLNFKDVMFAIGSLPDQAFRRGDRFNPSFGLDVAGIVHRVGKNVTELRQGEEVFAMTRSALATRVVCNRHMVVPKPKRLSMIEAATIPTVFLTAYYSLIYLARLEEGETCLIHSGTGGVGLAAIQLAQNICKANVIASVGSQEKEEYLRDNHQITEIVNSKSQDFAEHALELTDGRGVDVVLNSLDGDAIDKNFALLTKMGRFVEIGVKDIYDNKKVGLKSFFNNISYHAFDLDRLLDDHPRRLGGMLREIAVLLESGAIVPPPVKSYDATQITDALKYMTKGKHIGKVAIDMAPIHKIEIPPVYTLPSTGTYLITGGFKGLGLTLAQWLVEKQGISDLVLVGRSRPSDDSQKIISKLQQVANVRTELCDLSNLAKVRSMIRSVQSNMPPLKFVFHLAAIYDNVPVSSMTDELYKQVLSSKAVSARNLHEATSNIKLDQFYMFSSLSGIIGNMEQSGYAAANTVLDSIARFRNQQGLNAVSVSYGPIAGGLIASDYAIKQILIHRGLNPTHLNALFRSILDLSQKNGVFSVGSLDWEKFSQTYNHLQQFFNSNYVETVLVQEDIDYKVKVLELVAKAVGMSSSDVSEEYETSLSDIGLDSITSIQLKNAIDKNFGTGIVTQMELLQGMTAKTLEDKILVSVGATRVASKPVAKKNVETPIPVEKVPVKPAQQIETKQDQSEVVKTQPVARKPDVRPTTVNPVRPVASQSTSKASASRAFAEKAIDRHLYIYGIGTANPPPVSQMEAAASVARQYEAEMPDYEHKIIELYENTGIETRHMCYDVTKNSITELREKGIYNEIYKEVGPALALKSATIALKQWGGDVKDITHVVSCTCTGICVPDVNFLLIEKLGLSLDVQRVSVNLMGCFGGLSTLRTALGLASANPEKNRVLMVCTELSSIHYVVSSNQDEKIGSALFADGSAAMVVGCAPRKAEKPLFQVLNTAAVAIPKSLELMTWDLGPKGWTLGLSPQIPAMIFNSVPDFVKNMIKEYEITDMNQVDYTLHPGGKAILNAIEVALEIQDRQRTIGAWNILKNYGNMSSCSILFVMNDLATRSASSRDIKEFVIGLAFGPGLSVEGVLMRNCKF